MLYLTLIHHKKIGQKNTILAGRNAHKSFIQQCALLDIHPQWIYPKEEEWYNLCSCIISPEILENTLANKKSNLPMAVYITSPDYLGNIADIKGISMVCKKYNIPLLVDNAHGAYLKFLTPSCHPIDLGATMCCDSAHKTLPVLTGGAYLHIGKNSVDSYSLEGKHALSFFGSTSPSYLILQSLDLCNQILNKNYSYALSKTIDKVSSLKSTLQKHKISILPTEPLKIVIHCTLMDIYGEDLSVLLRKNKIELEFADKDFVVLMFTTELKDTDFLQLETLLIDIFSKKHSLFKKRIDQSPPLPTPSQPICSVREALFACGELVSTDTALGRICRCPNVACPPAIPIAISGEILTQEQISLFEYYNISSIDVIK